MLTETLLGLLESVYIQPRRLVFSMREPTRVTIPVLRGIWGAQLRELHEPVYHHVFRGVEGRPAYIIRPVPPLLGLDAAVDFILIGDGIGWQNWVMSGWELAGLSGIGKARIPFTVSSEGIDHTGDVIPRTVKSWNLREACQSVSGTWSEAAVTMFFPTPLRIIYKGHLVEAPTITDIMVAIVRRLKVFATPPAGFDWSVFQSSVVSVAQQVVCEDWSGERLHLRRYSAYQHQEIELHGVTGVLHCRNGVGALWPLLVAGEWLHLGKNTVMGMGMLVCETP